MAEGSYFYQMGQLVGQAIHQRWQDLESRYFVSVKDYGAKGDNSTDDTAAIQAALNANPNKLIFFPAGVYRISGELVVNTGCHLMGAGEGATYIRCTNATSNMFRVGSQSNSVVDVLIEGFHFDTTVQKTAGAAIYVENSHNIRIRNVRFGYNHAIPVHFVGGPDQFLYYLTDFEINSGVHGIVVEGYAQDVWIERGIIAGCANAGIWLKHCSGVYANSIDILNCHNGMQLLPYSGEEVRLCFFNQVIADTCAGNGWLLDASLGGTIMGINLTSCWGSSTIDRDGAGFHVTGTAGTIRGIALSTFRCMNNNGHGIILNRGEGITLTNCQVTKNSRYNLGQYSGIFVGAGRTGWSIVGGLVGRYGDTPASSGQRYGIVISAGCTEYSIIGVNLEGNVESGINDLATAGTVYGNRGYKTHENGEAMIPAGSSSVTVNHNMGFTPHVRDIIVWPLVNAEWTGVQHWWVSDANSTSFKINTNKNVSADFYFGWRVVYPHS